jgi:hypothetical protein
MPRLFKKLRRVTIEAYETGWLGDNEPRLRAMKHVAFV